MEDQMGSQEKVLVEVEGKFELVSTSEVQADEEILQSKEMNELLKKPPNEDNPKQKKPIYSFPRTTSAPTGKYISLPRKGHFDEERERLNEQAFQAWLNKKVQNEKTEKRRKLEEEASCRMIKEDKKVLNEKAFNSWIAKKRCLSRNEQKDIPQQIKDQHSMKNNEEAYEMWLKRKREEKYRIKVTEHHRKQKEEEIAQRTDPQLAQEAYKQWLVQKTHQAHEKAMTRNNSRKLFFKESHQLNKRFTSRFHGF